MRFDFGFECGGRLVAFALLRPGEQAVHGDLRLGGQLQGLIQGVDGCSGHDVVGGQHDGGRTLTGRIVRIGLTISETGQHRGAADHTVAYQRRGFLAVLRSLQPIGDLLVVAVLHLIDIVL